MPKFSCPICETSVEAPRIEALPHRPFCSKRCKLVDLGRWLDGTYRISEPLGELKDLGNLDEESVTFDDSE